jgi:hypothetical protein
MFVSKHLNLPDFVYKNGAYMLYISGQLDAELSKEYNTQRNQELNANQQENGYPGAKNLMKGS